ncbi:MAG: hypothetical protein JWN08_3560 [Frankiales bacterium]|nr:hypothetical protein [Frankiales bacterium]
MRVRVTVIAAVAVSIGLVAASAALVVSLRAGLIAGLDDSARSRATDAVSALRRGDTGLAVSSTGGESSLVQVLGSDGQVLASSPELAGVAPLVPVPAPPGAALPDELSISERDYRAFTTFAVGGRTVVVVTPMTDVEEAMVQLAGRVLLGAPVLLVLICGAVWVLVGYTLQTVDGLRGQVAALSASGLDRRVDVPVAHDEVRELAVTMNGLLDRLQRSAQVQRRFVADAAHELRNPLAALRARLEVNERADDPDAWKRAAPVMLQDTERLGRLVDDLLALARLDESPRLRRAEPVDLDEIVLAEVARLRETTSITVDARQVSAGLVHGDPGLLTRVVGNVLANAVRHATAVVQVSVATVDGQVELTVADDGPGIPPAERERVFERFHRLDEARARDVGGSGLGLAIVRDAVRAHGGVVSIQDARPGALVTVWLPQEVDSQQP